MASQFIRTELLFGEHAMADLEQAHVAVFGIGGVGSFCVEALARAGIGELSIFDNDIIEESNINRQLLATYKSLGKSKVSAMEERIQSINPSARVHNHRVFYNSETMNHFDFSRYRYIVDAIDTVSSKLLIIQNAISANTPIISSMGTGNKIDPSRLRLGDVYESSVCPLARVMRHELRRRGIKALRALYSTEKPIKPRLYADAPPAPGRRETPGSVSFVPSVAGLMIAGEIIRKIANVEPNLT